MWKALALALLISVSMVACASEETVKAEEKVIPLESVVQESVPEKEAGDQAESIKPSEIQEAEADDQEEATRPSDVQEKETDSQDEVVSEEKNPAGEQVTIIAEEAPQNAVADAVEFQDYLKANLKDTEYADLQIGMTGKPNIIWIVDETALNGVVASYEGAVPEFEVVVVSYSKQELDAAVDKVESDSLYSKGIKDKKISGVAARQGCLDILLNEPYPEFEQFVTENYGEMARIKVIGVNPET